MKSSTFQIILLSVFGALAAAGVLVFALAVGGKNPEAVIGNVTIWGTLDKRVFDSVLDQAIQNDQSLGGVSYLQKESSTFDQELANALAERRGPDLYIIRSDQALINEAKVSPVPYENISVNTFKAWFVDAADPFLGKSGIIAIPFMADPLVLYSNRDLLAAGGYASPPRYWDEVPPMASRLTVRDTSGTIRIATIALGTFRNIESAKPIISALITQAASASTTVQEAIVGEGTDGALQSLLSRSFGRSRSPAADALRFYTEFANPGQTDYSWNGSFASARRSFAGGQVALYIGFASEEPLIRATNPNLNYAVTALPQLRGAIIPVTFGRTYGFAIPLTSKNPQGAVMAAELLNTATTSSALARAFGAASAQRQALSQTAVQDEAFINREALVSRNWSDPDPAKTDALFGTMIESIVSGAATVDSALSRADQELQHLLDQL